jgi:hypothetical protein
MKHRADIRRHLVDTRRKRRLAQIEHWLRHLGRLTRPVAYIGAQTGMILLVFSLAVALAQTPNDLKPLDYLLVAGCVLGLLGTTIPLIRSFMNSDGGEIDWLSWGQMGTSLIALLAMLGILWLLRVTS